LCSGAIVASASPASAKSHHHGAGRHAHGHHHFSHHARHHVRHYASGHHGRRHYAHRHTRHVAHVSRWEHRAAQGEAQGFRDAYASVGTGAASGGITASSGFGSSVVAEARRYIGGNPTGRASLWCARFMNMVLQRSGYRGTGSDMAHSFATYGHRVFGPQVGAIAVMSRHGGGHVGVVSGVDEHGNPILVSGNNRNRVVEAPYPRGRIYAYVMPTN
jgi:uncharacterized protein (TIGR02594 family)